MKCLLDTHTLLWIVTDDSQLSAKVKKYYLNPENEIYVSIASVWEIAIKSSLGKLQLGKSLEVFIDLHVKGNDISILPIELPHIYRLEQLEFHHRDPFDRLIISQAIEDNISILSKDTFFDSYKVRRVW